ncbi:SlyX family protein [Comamonas sp. NLF-1-9]|uniref:SlyX family protein n=1 Tax=Comamonas sp. NLF-1-9 TaxID=2853163 RepID=UPI001C451EB5|nr:SlyX family protein [Comamonas sp. NLF-1-9]QXL85056.1 SlyX family protein [Comamonas sp. NLF-1-9]
MSTQQERLQALELKAVWAEDLLEQLNLSVFRQAQEIEQLRRQLAHLRQQLRDGAAPAAERDPRDEIPPHY